MLVFGFAANAFAIHADIPSDTTATVATGGTQITLSGEIRTRFDWQANTGFISGKPEVAIWDERVRLGLKAEVTPNTTGMIQLESSNENLTTKSQDWYAWGTGYGTGTYTTTSATGTYQVGNEPRPALNIIQAWLMNQGTGLLGVPAGFKIGHMPLALGNSLFFDHTKFGDDAVVAFLFPVKELELDAVAIKFREGDSVTSANNTSTENNAYAFIATYKADKDTSIGFDATYVDDQDVLNTLAGVNFNAIAPSLARPVLHFWNFGLRGNTAFSGLTMMVDGELQTAQTEHLSNYAGAGVSNLKMSGYALKAALGYKIDPVTLSLDFAMGSGDNGHSASATSPKTNFFVTSLGADQHYTYVYEYRTVSAAGSQYAGLTNTWYLKLGATADVTKDLNVLANLYYLQAVDTIGTNSPFYTGAGNTNDFSGAFFGGFTHTTNSHDIGTELDGKITYKIDKNLQYWVEGGYLWAGDFWHAVTGTAAVADAYSLRNGIQLNF